MAGTLLQKSLRGHVYAMLLVKLLLLITFPSQSAICTISQVIGLFSLASFPTIA